VTINPHFDEFIQFIVALDDSNEPVTIERLQTLGQQLKCITPSDTFSLIIRKLESNQPENNYSSFSGLIKDIQSCLEHKPFFPGRHDIPAQLQFSNLLYGREHDLATLLKWIENSEEKDPIFCISGDPGIGKTELIHRGLCLSLPQHMMFFETKCDQVNQSNFFCFNQLFKAIQGKTTPLIDLEISTLFKGTQTINSLEDKQALYVSILDKLSRVGSNLIFIDDFQWIDSQSSKILRTMCTNNNPLLRFVIAYRHNECPSSHAIHDLKKVVGSQEISITGLDPEAISLQLEDLFSLHPLDASELGQLLHTKTRGNPLFIRLLLQELIDQNALKYELENNQWIYDTEKIKLNPIDHTIITFILDQLDSLPEGSLTILQTLSIMGFKGTIPILSQLIDRNPLDFQLHLSFLEKKGFIITTNETIQFSHDRIREAAYNTISNPQHNHLTYAKALWNDSRLRKETLNECATHLLKGHTNTSHIDNNWASDVLLTAAQWNRQQGDLEQAVTLYKALFDIKPASKEELLEYWEALTLNKQPSETVWNTIKTYFDDSEFHIHAVSTQVRTYHCLNQIDTALSTSFNFINSELPSFSWYRKIFYITMIIVRGYFSNSYLRTIESSYPEIENAAERKIVDFLIDSICSAFKHDSRIFLIYSIYLERLLVKNKLLHSSPIALVGISIIYLRLGFYFVSKRLDQLSVTYSKKNQDIISESRISFIVSIFSNSYFVPMHQILSTLNSLQVTMTQTQDTIFDGYIELAIINCQILIGTPLSEVMNTCKNKLLEAEKKQNSIMVISIKIFEALVNRLQGSKDTSLWTLNIDTKQDYAKFILDWAKLYETIFFSHKDKTDQVRSFINEHFAGVADKAPYYANEFYIMTYLFYSQRSTLTLSEKRRMTFIEKKYKKWSTLCPENFEHKYALILAEKCMKKKTFLKAHFFYEKTIQLCKTFNYPHYAALSAERQAQTFQLENKPHLAKQCITSASEYYKQWGAIGKVNQGVID